jgi:uncharacterized protein YjiS (DUF1127 family)
MPPETAITPHSRDPNPRIASDSFRNRVLRFVCRIASERASRRELECMSDRVLADCGVSRAQLLFEYESSRASDPGLTLTSTKRFRT